MRRTRWGALAAFAALAIVLSGCAAIPRSGPVQNSQVIQDDSEPEVDYKPSGPQPGAEQEEILRGFIDAASSPANNYAIAREFLAPTLTSEWNPDAGVIVDERSRRTFVANGENGMVVTVIPLAEVDGAGVYGEATSEDPIAHRYQFTLVDDEWRISAAPNGVIMDPNYFEDVFTGYALTFFDPTLTYLVPDVRWFPSRASTSTRIVNALLDGPSEWLAPGVTTAFPEGTSLTASAVPIDNGTAVVDLNREALEADEITFRRMHAQLASSLVGVLNINAVTIAIDGNTEQVETLQVTEPRVDSRALVLTGDGFGFLGVGGELESIPGISSAIEALEPDAAVVDAEHGLAAAHTGDGVYAVAADTDPLLIDARPGVIEPTLDNDGYIWSVPENGPSQLIAFTPQGEQFPVTTTWPEATSIVSIALSRDGTRIAALLNSGGRTRLLAAAVERSENGTPLRLGDPIELATGSGEPIQVTWVDDRSVASLARNDESTVILRQTIGGRSEPITPLAGAVQIVGGNSLQQLRALTEDRELALRRPTAWQTTASGVRFIATQLGTPS